MSPALQFAQINSSGLNEGGMFAFVGFTLVFLFVFWRFDRPTRLASTFITWGILVAILSVGYAMTGIPSVVQLTQTLAKIGFLLVLGGLALAIYLTSQDSVGSNSKESGHD